MDGRPRRSGNSMGGGGAAAVPPAGMGGNPGSGLNGGSPTSFDIAASELEAARPQVSVSSLLKESVWQSLSGDGAAV